jgi:hypothetical protein
LLEHDLGDPHTIGVRRSAPRQLSPVAIEPDQQSGSACWRQLHSATGTEGRRDLSWTAIGHSGAVGRRAWIRNS